MAVPPKGRAVVGYYEGNYAGLKKLYAAMEKYIYDKHLHPVAAKYEKYLINPHSSADSLHMKIEIYYPIL
jgi:effector-binding domain-containing protein